MLRAFILSFSLFLLTSPTAFSAPSFKSSLTKTEIKHDEPTEFILLVQWPKSEGNYSFAIPDLPLQYLAVTNRAESQESFVKEDKEWIQKTFTFELTPKSSGEGSVEGFSVGYVNSNDPGGVPGQFQISPLKITITKRHLSQNKTPQTFVYILAGFGVLIAGFVLLVRKRKNPASQSAPETSAAQSKTEALKNKILNASYYSETSLVELSKEWRAFLVEAYQLKVSGISDSELLTHLKNKNLLSDEFKNIERIQNELRDAKFAGGRLSESEFSGLKKEIAQFIEGKQVQSFSSTK